MKISQIVRIFIDLAIEYLEYTYIRFGILPTMITTFGIRSNAHSSIAQICLTMDDLFQ